VRSRRRVAAAGVATVTLAAGSFATGGYAVVMAIRSDSIPAATFLLVAGALLAFLGAATVYAVGELVVEDAERRTEEAASILRGALDGVRGSSPMLVGEDGEENVRRYYGAHWPDRE